MAGEPTDGALELIKQRLLTPLDLRYLCGPQRSIYCYRGEDGSCPALEFLNELPKEAKASYTKSFEKHCQGHQLRGDKHRVWTNKGCEGLAEYKDIQSKSRLVHTWEVGNVVVLLYGFLGKKEDDIPLHHVNAAKRLRDEYQRRRESLTTRGRPR